MSDELLNFSVTIGGIIGIIILSLFVNFIKKTTGKIGKRKQPKVKAMNNMHSQEVRIDRQETNKCSKCGNVVEDETIFCDKCGTRIR